MSPPAPCCPLCASMLCACGCGKAVAPSGNRRKDGLRFRRGHQGRKPTVSQPAPEAEPDTVPAIALEAREEFDEVWRRFMALRQEIRATSSTHQHHPEEP